MTGKQVIIPIAALHAQVSIGGLDAPTAGGLLDLNKKIKGGLILSNVKIVDPELIPFDTDVFPGIDGTNNDTNWDFPGAMVYNPGTANVPAGVYIWNGKSWTTDGKRAISVERISFTVQVPDSDKTYIIPTCGHVSGIHHSYDWDISIDDAKPVLYSGIGGSQSGIPLTFSSSGNHRIEITPRNKPEPGWGNAFGYTTSYDGSNVAANKQKLISIDAPLTTMAFAPNGNTANASRMFAFMFHGCTNLTAPATFLDTYKPARINDLSYFLSYLHLNNSNLTAPVNLMPLREWFPPNRSFTGLEGFLNRTHQDNPKLRLTGQIIFPNWIKTLARNKTPIIKVNYCFIATFKCSNRQTGDTDEPGFEDNTKLSSIGTPDSPKGTYENRVGISAANPWK